MEAFANRVRLSTTYEGAIPFSFHLAKSSCCSALADCCRPMPVPYLASLKRTHVSEDAAQRSCICLTKSVPLLQVLAASEHARGKTVQHKLEMKGCIPPWVVDRVTRVIKDAHPAKFQVHFASHIPTSHRQDETFIVASAIMPAALWRCQIAWPVGPADPGNTHTLSTFCAICYVVLSVKCTKVAKPLVSI